MYRYTERKGLRTSSKPHFLNSPSPDPEAVFLNRRLFGAAVWGRDRAVAVGRMRGVGLEGTAREGVR